MPTEPVFLSLAIAAIALVYATVGHAGATGYLAILAFSSLPVTVFKPTALVLNVAVASIAFVQFYRAKAFAFRLLWPLALASMPCAYLGGLVHLPSSDYKRLVGVLLIMAAIISLYRHFKPAAPYTPSPPALPWLLAVGALLGFLSGLTGVGGGIFLSPLLFYLRWADIKVISGVAAAFIWLNSVAGLAALPLASLSWPQALPLWLLSAALAGCAGAYLGSRRLPRPLLVNLLALVVLIGGLKMLFS